MQRTLVLMLVVLSLAACGKTEIPIQQAPLSHWLDPKVTSNECERLTARAILESGRPWPNEIRDERGHLIRFDLWVGNQLYEMPMKPGGPISHLGAPQNHPLRYSVFGNAEEVLGIPREERMKFKHPGVGSTLYGYIRCYAHLPPSSWVENRWSNAPSRTELLELIRSKSVNPDRYARRVETERTDIGMTEFKSIPLNPALERSSGASYVPFNRDIVQEINGRKVFKSIGCSAPYDPDLPLKTSEQCTVWVYLGPGLWAEFSVYHQAMLVLPELHDHMVRLFETARRK